MYRGEYNVLFPSAQPPSVYGSRFTHYTTNQPNYNLLECWISYVLSIYGYVNVKAKEHLVRMCGLDGYGEAKSTFLQWVQPSCHLNTEQGVSHYGYTTQGMRYTAVGESL